MKRTLLLFAFMQVFLAGHSQEVYNTFVVEGKRWNCASVSTRPDSEPIPFCYYLKGDTIISGQACKKMYQEYPTGNTPDYIGAFHENDRKVYVCPKDGQQTSTWFDYAANISEKYTLYGQEFELIRVDTLESCGHKYRVNYLFYDNWKGNVSSIELIKEGVPVNPIIIVDGIGGDIGNMVFPGSGIQNGGNHLLLNCEQEGQVIYSASDVNSFIYNLDVYQWFDDWLDRRIRNGIQVPKQPIVTNSAPLFDLQGRHIQGRPARKGIYIRGGRKYVRK